MLPAVGVASGVIALLQRRRGAELSRACDVALDDLEDAEAELEETKKGMKALREQCQTLEASVSEVSALYVETTSSLVIELLCPRIASRRQESSRDEASEGLNFLHTPTLSNPIPSVSHTSLPFRTYLLTSTRPSLSRSTADETESESRGRSFRGI